MAVSPLHDAAADASRVELERLKAVLLSNLGHEIRTPLSGILGMADLLFETDLDDEQREYVTAARTCAQDLLHILNATLEFAALEAGQLRLDETEFSLREVLDSAVAQHRGRMQAKGLELAVTLDPALPETLLGDAARMREVLVHLIDNAIKFTTHGKITVALARDHDELRAVVRDTGIGIPASRQTHIFESFRQVEMGLSRDYPGMGLGLALVQKLVTMMGGKIEVESEPGVGSTFTLLIPLKRAAAPSAEARVSGAGRPRILAVDDNPLGLMVLRHSLKTRAVSVDTAPDGRAAVEAAAKQRYDLILMDLQLPKMDGLDTTTEIRKLPGYAGIPIIAITANSSDSIRQDCHRRGMQGFLAMPVESTELWSAISRHLRL